jgi:hypothetical protein
MFAKLNLLLSTQELQLDVLAQELDVILGSLSLFPDKLEQISWNDLLRSKLLQSLSGSELFDLLAYSDHDWVAYVERHEEFLDGGIPSIPAEICLYLYENWVSQAGDLVGTLDDEVYEMSVVKDQEGNEMKLVFVSHSGARSIYKINDLNKFRTFNSMALQ